MAADWIPIRKDLDRCREVSILVEQTQLSVNEVVGQLVRFWAWVDGETTDGWLPGATEKTLEISSAICPQVVRIMSAVKWLELHEDGIRVVNFNNWFGQNAKRRLTDARRKRIHRQQLQDIEPSAERPRLVRKTSKKNVTTEQNRTEQKREEKIHAAEPPERDPLLDNEAVKVWRQKIRLTPPAGASRERIAAEVLELERWGQVLDAWVTRGHNKQNIDGQLAWYRDGIPSYANGKQPGKSQQGKSYIFDDTKWD